MSTREPLAMRVHRDLAARINAGEFRPGSRLPTEKELSSAYGVSRPVVREAISVLRADGLVQVRQGSGVFSLGARGVPYTGSRPDISSITDAVDTLELRLSIECEAAALAALRSTPDQREQCAALVEGMRQAIEAGEGAIDWDTRFHQLIAAMTHNEKFLMLFQMFGEKLIPRTRFARTDGDSAALKDYLHRVNGEHMAVLAAIQRKDGDTARAAMRIHLANVKEGLKAALDASRR
jgi:GntR family transcriptional regulator, transcriptional repressor for pyruvate dehydrogenase complex